MPHSYGASLAADGRRGASSREATNESAPNSDRQHHQTATIGQVLAHGQPAASAFRLRLRATKRSRRWSSPHSAEEHDRRADADVAPPARATSRGRGPCTRTGAGCDGSISGDRRRPAGLGAQRHERGDLDQRCSSGLCQKAIWSSSSPSGLGYASPPISYTFVTSNSPASKTSSSSRNTPAAASA